MPRSVYQERRASHQYWNHFAPFRARRAELASNLDHVHAVLKSGAEDRDVEVYEVPRAGSSMIDVHRADTHELVDTREMTESERQVAMFPPLAEASRKVEDIAHDLVDHVGLDGAVEIVDTIQRARRRRTS